MMAFTVRLHRHCHGYREVISQERKESWSSLLGTGPLHRHRHRFWWPPASCHSKAPRYFPNFVPWPLRGRKSNNCQCSLAEGVAPHTSYCRILPPPFVVRHSPCRCNTAALGSLLHKRSWPLPSCMTKSIIHARFYFTVLGHHKFSNRRHQKDETTTRPPWCYHVEEEGGEAVIENEIRFSASFGSWVTSPFWKKKREKRDSWVFGLKHATSVCNLQLTTMHNGMRESRHTIFLKYIHWGEAENPRIVGEEIWT